MSRGTAQVTSFNELVGLARSAFARPKVDAVFKDRTEVSVRNPEGLAFPDVLQAAREAVQALSPQELRLLLREKYEDFIWVVRAWRRSLESADSPEANCLKRDYDQADLLRLARELEGSLPPSPELSTFRTHISQWARASLRDDLWEALQQDRSIREEEERRRRRFMRATGILIRH